MGGAVTAEEVITVVLAVVIDIVLTAVIHLIGLMKTRIRK